MNNCAGCVNENVIGGPCVGCVDSSNRIEWEEEMEICAKCRKPDLCERRGQCMDAAASEPAGEWVESTDEHGRRRAVFAPAEPATPELGDRFMEILRAIHGDMPDAFADSARLAFVHALKEAHQAEPAALSDADLRYVSSVLDDVLADISDWEDKALAEAVTEAKARIERAVRGQTCK